jgi:D-sedoheptulose 7-phosphate isomerase
MKKKLLFRNSDSSSNYAHIVTDLVKVNKIKALSFNDYNLITCIANDYGFENWIKQTIKNFCSKDDFVILISLSGNSKNMLNAAKYCLKHKIKFTSLTGFKKNPLSKFGRDNIWINSKSYNYVETAHFQI